MPVYEFTAAREDGTLESGLTHGSSFEAVVASFAERGLTIQKLGIAENSDDPVVAAEKSRRETGQGIPTPPPVEARNPVMTQLIGPLVGTSSLPALQFFFRQMGTMLHAGVPMVQSLETLARQSTSPVLKVILNEAKEHVIAGQPLSVAIQRYPEVFSPLMISMVRAGEAGGFLSDQCAMLSDYIQRDIELRNMIKRETAYPKFVIGASAIIILAANAVISAVAPGHSGIAPPWFIWGFFIIAATAGFFFVRVGLKIPHIKLAYDQFVLGIPGIGGMIKGFAMAKFGRAFGALYKGGVPLPQALTLAADACGNEYLRSRMHPAARRLEEGAGITETFAETGAFSPLVLDMTRTGEMTGNMDMMLLKVAEYYEDEGQTRAKQSALLLGIACLLLVGIYVGYIVISFYAGYGASYGSQLNDAGG